MNIKHLMNMGKLFFMKNKATIELVSGAGLVVAGTFVLIHDANKIAEVNNELEADKEYIKTIDEVVKNPAENTSWAEETGKTKCNYIIGRGVHHSLAYAKVCGKGLLCVGTGLGLIGMSHADLTKQIQTISAAAAAEAMSFANYRKNVIKDAGAEKDYEYLTGGTTKTVTVSEDGTVTEVTTRVPKPLEGSCAPHSFWLSDTGLYTGNNLRDWANVERALNIVNQHLQYKGYMFGNEMFDVFQANHTVADQCAGAWAQNKDGSLNYIDIQVAPGVRDAFKQGLESDILITLSYVGGKPLEDNLLNDDRIQNIMGWKLF